MKIKRLDKILFIAVVSLLGLIAFFAKNLKAIELPIEITSFVSSKLKDTAVSDNSVTLILGGDVMLGRTVMTTSIEKKDYTYPFLKIADLLKNADLTFVNLENPVVVNCPERVEGLIFCADPKTLEGLTFAGVDIVNLANNHTLNYGQNGFEETKDNLDEVSIKHVGESNFVIKKVNGMSFGFLGFEKSQQVNPKLSEEEINLIKESDRKVDVLIVAMHWGVEYQDKALAGVGALARELVDLGADIVVGHHPHWVQDIEYINGVPVYYSLGNLVFDQMWSDKTREGLVVKLTFDNKKLVGEELIKTYMENWAQPEVVK